MTKQEMIDIIKEKEIILWCDMQKSIKENGADSLITINLRNQWYAISLLSEELGIELDDMSICT